MLYSILATFSLATYKPLYIDPPVCTTRVIEMMKVARCVVILPVVLLASCVYAEEDCTEVDSGSSSDVCSMLQDKLQSALVQNPTNLYKIRKAFVNPVPPLINVEYEVEWGNMTTRMCTPNTARVFTNSTTPHNTSNYTYLWTNILYFTTISPAFLQHLQLQAPYFINYVIVKIQPLFGKVNKHYIVNAMLWNGCSTRMLLNIQLSLKVDTLPCTPSELQLESSIQELTTWLQAYTDIWPQDSLKLDVDKKFYAIFHHPPARFSRSEGVWKVITGIIVIVAIILFFIVVFLLHLVKRYLNEENSKIDKNVLHPLSAIFIWNMFIVLTEIWAITTTCSTELFSFSLKITLFVMLAVYFLSRVVQCLREYVKSDLNIKKILIINFLIQWNLFLSIEFLITSVVVAELLAYAYPLQVLATAALLTTGLIFYVLFWAVFLRTLYERPALNDCQSRLPQEILCLETKTVLKCFFFLLNYAGGAALIVTLLGILGFGILRGEGNIHGPLFSFLPSGIFFVLSLLSHKFSKKKEAGRWFTTIKEDSEDNEDSESGLEDGSEQTSTLEGYIRLEDVVTEVSSAQI